MLPERGGQTLGLVEIVIIISIIIIIILIIIIVIISQAVIRCPCLSSVTTSLLHPAPE